MSSCSIHLINRPEGQPDVVTLPGIPRIGDELRFGDQGSYGVNRVVWDISTGHIFVCLIKLDVAGLAVSK